MRILEADRFAVIWFLLAAVSLPSLVYVAWNAMMTNGGSISSRHLVSPFVAFSVQIYLVIFTFRIFRNFTSREFEWAAEQGNVWATLRRVLFLEVVSIITFNLDDLANATTNMFRVEPYPLTFGAAEYFIEYREIAHITILLLTLPLAKRLIVAYFDLAATWLASGFHLLSGLSWQEAVPKEGETQVAARPDANRSVPIFQNSASEAIDRAEFRILLAALAIVVTAVTAIFMFQAVFESSATRRANVLIEGIEASPVALSVEYIDITRDLELVIDTLSRPGVVVSDSHGSMPLTTRTLGQTTLEDFLRRTRLDLQEVKDSEGAMRAEAEDFLLRLTELKRELEGVSRTNWDIIVVRTAIIVLALVVVGIFQRILMSAIQERRAWEVKASAMSALSVGHLKATDVKNFLDIIRAEPFEDQRGRKSFPKHADVDAIVARLEELVNPKPPTN